MIEKFKDGETVAEYRYRRRQQRKAALVDVKRELLKRDGPGCRWPGCEFPKRGYRVDAAHVIQAAGLGGDPTLLRSTLNQLARICCQHHTGPVSLHSGDLRIVTLSEHGTNGPLQFEMRDHKAPKGWAVVGIEDPFVYIPRASDDDGEE